MTYKQKLAYWHHRLDDNRLETLRRIQCVWAAGAGGGRGPRTSKPAQGGGPAPALSLNPSH